MAILRTIKCTFKDCLETQTEGTAGEGFPGWGGVHGVLKDGQEIHLCPKHLTTICEVIDRG